MFLTTGMYINIYIQNIKKPGATAPASIASTHLAVNWNSGW